MKMVPQVDLLVAKPGHGKERLDLSPYPVDLAAVLPVPPSYHPTTITHYALTQWNQYLTSKTEEHRNAFLAQAIWLVEHEVRIGEDAGGWPITTPHHEVHTRGSWLSALAQGCALSVLTRAFQLTGNQLFLTVAARVVHTLELDILDGGVSTPIGADGVFFEEVAVYPAAHHLIGCLVALLGLSDYVALTAQSPIAQLVARGLHTLHTLLGEFDRGYWTCAELGQRRLSSPAQLEVQVQLLEALARSAGCGQCSALAARWRRYSCCLSSRLRYQISSRCTSAGHALLKHFRSRLFPKVQASPFHRVCIPVTNFPFTGGVLTVLNTIAQVTTGAWQIEYATQNVGPNPNRLVIHHFGTARMTPWHFPSVWLYVLTGSQKLISLMRHGAAYDLILPQDGVFTAAFAAPVARLTGTRVVCIDHSTLTWTKSHLLHGVYTSWLATKNWPWTLRRLAQLLLVLYWPSLCLLARISVRFVDHFLIPGVAGDEMEEMCNLLKIPQSRVMRFASMIDIRQHIVLDAASRSKLRKEKGIAVDAIVIAIICRLSPEKGLDVALESIRQALSTLSDERRERVRVIIAGDGPLRKQLEEGIHSYGLSHICWLWGDISAQDVLSLLAISDIFLYTSTRGACIPMSVLEAMASGCAVIATTQPLANAHLLAEGRGIIVPVGDAEQTATALVRLVNDLELCRRMGNLARDYIALHHSPAMFRRTLMRATYWSALDDLLYAAKIENVGIES